jgi:hypothetical protein
MVVMLDATTEDLIEYGGWLDYLFIFPASLGTQDFGKWITLCPFVEVDPCEGYFIMYKINIFEETL